MRTVKQGIMGSLRNYACAEAYKDEKASETFWKAFLDKGLTPLLPASIVATNSAKKMRSTGVDKASVIFISDGMNSTNMGVSVRNSKAKPGSAEEQLFNKEFTRYGIHFLFNKEGSFVVDGKEFPIHKNADLDNSLIGGMMQYNKEHGVNTLFSYINTYGNTPELGPFFKRSTSDFIDIIASGFYENYNATSTGESVFVYKPEEDKNQKPASVSHVVLYNKSIRETKNNFPDANKVRKSDDGTYNKTDVKKYLKRFNEKNTVYSVLAKIFAESIA